MKIYKRNVHEIEGINSRLDGIQAAILRVKLPHLAGWTEKRRAVAKRYDELLAGVPGISTPFESERCSHVYHLYALDADDRDGLAEALKARGIPTVVNYRTALPFVPAYAAFNHRPEDFPVASHLQDHTLSLPIFAELTEAQQDRVVEAVRDEKMT